MSINTLMKDGISFHFITVNYKRQSSGRPNKVSTVTRLQAGQTRNDNLFLALEAFFSYLKCPGSFGSHPASYFMVMGGRVFRCGVKWLWLEAGHSSSSSAEVKNAWICTFTPQNVFILRIVIILPVQMKLLSNHLLTLQVIMQK